MYSLYWVLIGYTRDVYVLTVLVLIGYTRDVYVLTVLSIQEYRYVCTLIPIFLYINPL